MPFSVAHSYQPMKVLLVSDMWSAVFIHRMQIRIAKTFLKHASYWYSSRNNVQRSNYADIF